MKLKCKTHNKRVMVLINARKVIHRENGSNCQDGFLRIGGRDLTLIEVVLRNK